MGTKILVPKDLFNYSANINKLRSDSVSEKLSHEFKSIANETDNGCTLREEKNLTPHE